MNDTDANQKYTVKIYWPNDANGQNQKNMDIKLNFPDNFPAVNELLQIQMRIENETAGFEVKVVRRYFHEGNPVISFDNAKFDIFFDLIFIKDENRWYDLALRKENTAQEVEIFRF